MTLEVILSLFVACLVNRTTKVEKEGFKGLFNGNGLNVLRVAPAKAIELAVFESIYQFTGILYPLSLLRAPYVYSQYTGLRVSHLMVSRNTKLATLVPTFVWCAHV